MHWFKHVRNIRGYGQDTHMLKCYWLFCNNSNSTCPYRHIGAWCFIVLIHFRTCRPCLYLARKGINYSLDLVLFSFFLMEETVAQLLIYWGLPLGIIWRVSFNFIYIMFNRFQSTFVPWLWLWRKGLVIVIIIPCTFWSGAITYLLIWSYNVPADLEL